MIPRYCSRAGGGSWLCIQIIVEGTAGAIILLMRRLTADQLRKMMPLFEMEAYRGSEDPKEYLHDLLLVALHKRRITQPLLCMNELIEIVGQLGIPLRTHQMSQLYLYATYQRYENLADTKKKLIAILNQEKKKVDLTAAAEWLHEKITAKEIVFASKVKRQRATSVQAPTRR